MQVGIGLMRMQRRKETRSTGAKNQDIGLYGFNRCHNALLSLDNA
jgi:hypothetical protein